MTQIAGRYTQVEPQRRAGQLVLRLLSDLPRKSCWTNAERAAKRAPPTARSTRSGRPSRTPEQVRTPCAAYLVEHLPDDQAVLVVDETGDVKNGTDTIGAADLMTPCRQCGGRSTRRWWLREGLGP